MLWHAADLPVHAGRLRAGPRGGGYDDGVWPGAGAQAVRAAYCVVKNWRILTKLRIDPARATHLLRALAVLPNLEVNRGF
ncbi:hypothetical protein [Streptomyces sp. NPDC088246]|uniref:hypothetical protein n=1 Tax=Streptomyces sp. NPDC088246 TaxID=3365842 RepID=UPI00382096FB